MIFQERDRAVEELGPLRVKLLPLQKPAMAIYVIASLLAFAGFALPLGAPRYGFIIGMMAVASLGGLLMTYLTRTLVWSAWSTYEAVVAIGGAFAGEHPSTTFKWTVASLSIAAALVGMGAVIRIMRRTKELDRVLSLEATSVAFFSTMVFVLTYALLESWLKTPRLSLWVVWAVGMGTFAVASMLFRRKYS